MPPLFDDDVVSPELALVDPELAERARAALPPRGPQRRVPAVAAPAVVDAVSSRRRRVAGPVLMLLATAASSLVVTAVTEPERASGEPPVASALPHAAAPTTSASRSTPAAVAASTRTKSAGGVVQPSLGSGQTVRSAAAAPLGSVSSVQRRSSPSSSVRAEARTLSTAISPTTLVWPRSTQASAYDLELKRDDAVIFAARVPSSQLVLPRSWSRDGATYAIQPEDEAFVWPVLDGRRHDAPIVAGALALDMTLVERFVELSRSRIHR